MKLLPAEDWQAHPGSFVALWTDAAYAYALYQPGELVATPLADNAYPALRHPGAAWFQRLAFDTRGHTALGAADTRPAIAQFRAPDGTAPWPEFPPHPGEGVHQLALGPVHGIITEPAYLRFSLLGEQVLQLEARLGYSHRGVLDLMRGKSPRVAARFAARISGDATVAHSASFAQATEAALGLEPPARAVALRAIMLEMERLANHAGCLAAIAGETGPAVLAARLSRHREALCMAAFEAFGHRLMMDIVIPGGVAGDIATPGADAINAALDALEAELLTLDFTAVEDRLGGIGVISPALAEAYAIGAAGDAAVRVRLRLSEIAGSIRLIRNILSALPDTTIAIAPPSGSATGLGMAESFRGPVWVWLSIAAGIITDVFVADPSTLLWPLLEHAATTGGLADFPLIGKSINPSGPAVDL